MLRRQSALWAALVAVAAGSAADEPRYLWIPNAVEGTVSKLDAANGAEVARYASITHALIVDLMGVGGGALPPWGAVHQPQGVALDFHGNAWIANLAPGEQPSVTRILNHEPNCLDRDGSSSIETSREVNGTPGIQLADPEEFFGEQDECLAFTVIVGIDDGQPRSLAVDAGSAPGDEGDVWVGFRTEQAFYQLDGRTGGLLRRVPPVGPSPYHPFGAAIDGSGQLWSSDGCCVSLPRRLWRIDTATGADAVTPPATPDGCSGAYDVAVDLAGFVWLSGYPCGSAARYDPVSTTWAGAVIPGYTTSGAVGVTPDGLGNVWLVIRDALGDGAFARMDAALVIPSGVWDTGGLYSMGVALDSSGDVWSTNGASANVSRLHIDPVTHEPAPHPDTGNTLDLFAVGPGTEAFGDFSGQRLRRVTRPDPPGLVFADGFYSGSTAAWSAAVP
jgi:hypothetical protein